MMTDKDIQAMLDRYMEGLTTLEEEGILADFFKQNTHVKEEWKAYQEMFSFISNMRKESSQKSRKQAKSHKVRLYTLSAIAAAAVLLLFFSPWSKDAEKISNINPQQPIIAKNVTDTTSTVKTDSLQQQQKRHSATHKKHLRRHEMPQMPKTYMAQIIVEKKQDSINNNADEKFQQMELHQARIDRAIDIYLAQKAQMMASITEDNENENTY